MIKFNLIPLRILFVATSLLFSSNQVRSGDINKLITKICLKGFETEMNLAGKEPQIDIGEFACDCFIKQVSSGSGIASAQARCKKKTSKRFSI